MIAPRELEILHPTKGRSHVCGEFVGPRTLSGTQAVLIKFVKPDGSMGLSLQSPVIVVLDSEWRIVLYNPRDHEAGLNDQSVRWLAMHLEWPPPDHGKTTPKQKPKMMREILQEFADTLPDGLAQRQN